jgi:uncharacterized membrane protein
MTVRNSEVTGPVDYVLLEFPDQEPSGETAAALLDLADAGIIHVYDIVAIRKTSDGSVSGVEITDLGTDGAGFALFAGARSGLMDDDDIADAGTAMKPGTVAVLLVYENTWAVPFVAATHRSGGQLVASARIPAQNIIDVLDAVEAIN